MTTPSRATIKQNINNRIKVVKDQIKPIQHKFNTEPNEQIKDLLIKDMEPLVIELSDLEVELDNLVNEDKMAAETSLLKYVNDNDIAYLADEGKYLIVNNISTSPKMVTLQEKTIDPARIIGVLNKLLKTPKKFKDLKNDDIRGVFEDANKTYIGRTASFNDDKWDNGFIYNSLSIQRKYWCTLNDDPYNNMFDELMYSVGGGKQENIDHLEQWVAYKYLYPERSVTTPNLEVVGQPGGNGKGILKNLIKSVFIPQNVGGVKTKNITNGFNAIMEGKVVVVVDDPPADSNISSEFKESAGNVDAIIERKGIDAYEVDNTSNWLMTVNKSLIKLYGGGSNGEDRRISIIHTSIPLVSHLNKKYNCNGDEAKQLANAINDLASDRREVGKWLSHVIKKHGVEKFNTLSALHGEDYYNRFEDQKDQYTDVFESLLPIFKKHEFMPNKFVVEVVNAIVQRHATPVSIHSKFKEFLLRSGIDIEPAGNQVQIEITINGKVVQSIRDKVKRIKGSVNTTFEYTDISSQTIFNPHNPIEAHDVQIKDYFNVQSDKDKLADLLQRNFK